MPFFKLIQVEQSSEKMKRKNVQRGLGKESLLRETDHKWKNPLCDPMMMNAMVKIAFLFANKF